MRIKILYQLIVVLSLLSCQGRNNEISIETDKINIDSLEKVAYQAYADNPVLAVNVFKKVASEYRKSNNYKKSGQTNLNIAGIYEEGLNEFPKALIYAKKPLEDWAYAKNTMQIANLYKYIGYLEGLNRNYNKAESDIQTAIKFYEKLNYSQGKAVSDINMSKVQVMKANFAEAIVYYKLSKNYWKDQRNGSRIFDNNLVGIEIFQNMNQTKQVAKLIEENELIMKAEEINKHLVTKFNRLLVENPVANIE